MQYLPLCITYNDIPIMLCKDRLIVLLGFTGIGFRVEFTLTFITA